MSVLPLMVQGWLFARRGSLLFGLVASTLLPACADVCATGEVCARDCPTGGVAICAAHGLCACLRAPDGGSLTDGGSPLPEGADATDPALGPLEVPEAAGCVAPTSGDLVINEVLLDGEPTEDGEFVELVSTRAAPVALAGVRLTSNRGAEQVRRVEFTGGCLPPGAALAVFPTRGDWVESSPAQPPLEAELRSFGFANSGDFDFRLMRGDALLDRLEGSGELIAPGISVNRAPDLRGPPRPHDGLDTAGRPASPGRCPNGARYEEGCIPPEDGAVGVDGGAPGGPDAEVGQVDAGIPDSGPLFDCLAPVPGELRINEVLIDGEIPRTEADEFVEVVNTAPSARRLRDVALAVEAADGTYEARVRFADGCLPPDGAVVMRPELADWLFEPPLVPPATVHEARLALGNETSSPIVLLGPEGSELDRFDPAGAAVVEGVSLNRVPELFGEDWALHDGLGEHHSSPGRCVGGAAFADGCPAFAEDPAPDCAAPTAETLVINEVLVDGVADGEADEFIELVNRAPEPLALPGLSLWSSRADGELIERVTFERGCLAPGALAIFGERAAWLGGDVTITARTQRLALPNEAPVVIALRFDALEWSVEIPRASVAEGISVVREVDGEASAQWVRHDGVSAWATSPGLRSDGTPFEDLPDVER